MYAFYQVLGMQCLPAQDVEKAWVCNQESDEHSSREIHVSKTEKFVCHNHRNAMAEPRRYQLIVASPLPA